MKSTDLISVFCRPVPFWSWNDKLEPDELRRQIGAMQDAGMGGFFMHARGGLETEYLSEEWFRAVETSVDEAKKRGMQAWCYDENGWPSGFAGMKLLEDSANFAHYLTCEAKATFDPMALACYRLEEGHLIRVWRDEGESCVCLYDRTNSSVVDILNPEIVQKFIEETHEKYYERFKDQFGRVLMGFFTDEPQYFRYQTAYSPVMLKAYRERYGEDLLKELGAKWVVSRAERDVQEKFLLRNGADQVVYPEKQMAKWTAIRYSSDHVFDYIEIDSQYAIFEVEIPENWIGKNVGQLDIRKKYGINILATRKYGKTDVAVSPETVLDGDATILVLGEYKAIQKCFRI